MKTTAFLSIVASVGLFVACSTKPQAGSFADIDSSGWAYGDSVVFNIPQDSLAPSRWAVAVRHAAGYKFANIWLELTATSADTVVRDTLNIVLADKYGNRLGKGVGVSFIKIDTVGNLPPEVQTIALRHIMRVDTVGDIEQIGIYSLD